jgi:CBS domain containing-hemolysin-like protein
MYGESAIAHFMEPILHNSFHLEGEIVHTISFVVALGIITYLHVVIGEMVPKSMALQSAERMVFALSTPMLLMQTVFSWAITALNKIGVFILWLMRVPPPQEGERLHTSDELELIISDSVVGGLVEAEEQQLLTNIFDFADLHVRQIMVPRPRIEAVPVTIGKEALFQKIFTSAHTRLPVYENDLDHIIGIVHLKDLVHHHLDGTPFELRELLHDVPVVPENLQVNELLTTLKQQHIHMAIVLDEYGGTAGIVTLEDLMEEVMGEVRDEFDINEADLITVVDEGHLVVQGVTRLDELSEYVDLSSVEQSQGIDTVGGLMVANLPLPPQQGGEVQINGVTFRAEQVKGLSVERVSVRFNRNGSPNGAAKQTPS